MRTIDEESIRTAAAADTADLTGDLTDTLTDTGKYTVAILFAITLIQHMEVIDIKDNGIHRHISVVLIIHLYITQEVIQVEQVGQTVAFSRLDDIALFCKFDTPVDTSLDDFSRRIRFRNEVDRADQQTVDLGTLVSRHDNDRNTLEFFFFLHDLQNFHATHVRHLQIQQH